VKLFQICCGKNKAIIVGIAVNDTTFGYCMGTLLACSSKECPGKIGCRIKRQFRSWEIGPFSTPKTAPMVEL
jgi:hypothetical protein